MENEELIEHKNWVVRVADLTALSVLFVSVGLGL